MEKVVKINLEAINGFLTREEIVDAKKRAIASFDTLINRSGIGNDYLGWLDLPTNTDEAVLQRIDQIVALWKDKIEVVVVIGIGGSYLGAKAAIDALSHSFGAYLGRRSFPVILYAGQNLSEDYMAELFDIIDKKSIACVVISKSGITTEPAVAFRMIRKSLEERYGKVEAANRIVAVTDKSHGALKELADSEGYETFIIPDDVGGRYSVLTPVGLLPIALAGFDIRFLLRGACLMQKICHLRDHNNPAIEYAAIRNALYNKGWKIEILANYNPKLQYFAEWWKQLFGESEGKNGKGIYPASVNYTTDLHSMGQYIQSGERILFESVLSVEDSSRCAVIPEDARNMDGLNFIAGKRIDECNKMAEAATRIAHVDGGVPNIRIIIGNISEYSLGALFYFFEFACGISAYMMEINPFDQPGVEDYKNNMFALLGKPGYEEIAEKLRRRV
ncbi:MAG TPA: glucose-6-phosphate isomerase [Rikenellaceae bacterium]|nr:glucose-6-phosphate isomerase [Rikenellaceae bacterium]